MHTHLIRTHSNSGWCYEPLLETVAQSPCSLFIVLRHRMSSPPIYLFKVIHKPFALSRVFLLSSEGKSIVLVKKKAPSRSGFPLSMYVVLKTRHVNPNIHVRRYQSYVRSPNLSATRPQLFIPTRSNSLIQVTSQSYIAFFAILYSSTLRTHVPIYGLLQRRGVATNRGQHNDQQWFIAPTTIEIGLDESESAHRSLLYQDIRYIAMAVSYQVSIFLELSAECTFSYKISIFYR